MGIVLGIAHRKGKEGCRRRVGTVTECIELWSRSTLISRLTRPNPAGEWPERAQKLSGLTSSGNRESHSVTCGIYQLRSVPDG